MMVEANHTEATTETVAGDGVQTVSDKFELSKEEYDELQKIRTEHGNYKKDLKDARLQIEELKKPQTPKETKPDEAGLLQKGYLRMAGISAEDEVEFALVTAKKWGMDVDKLIDDEDFQVKLKRMRDTKSNAEATSNVRGGAGTSQAKNTPEYWKAKGTPPTPDEVPDTKLRRKIVREMMESASNRGTKFYNE